jgi:hypothetical protein
MELSDAPEKIGIDPGTFRLVEQCLNHYTTPGPRKKKEKSATENVCTKKACYINLPITSFSEF